MIGLDVMATERIWEAMLPVTFDQLRDRRLAMQAIALVVVDWSQRPIDRQLGEVRADAAELGVDVGE